MLTKFHWGHGITLFFVFFVGTLVFILFKSMTIDHSLVVDDYYAKDIAYQEEYDKRSRSLNTKALTIQRSDNSKELVFVFPSDNVSGNIHFYRPSQKSLDFMVPIHANNTSVDLSKLKEGKWIAKVTWQIDGVDYIWDEEIFV